MAEEKLIGKITHYFSNIQVGIIELTNGEVKVGDTVHFKGHTTDFEQEITSMQIEHQNIKKAQKDDEFGVKVDEKVKEGDKVYLVS